jgi:hypothetical protein
MIGSMGRKGMSAAVVLAALLGSEAVAEHNALTQQEKDAGYTQVFNGKDLSTFHTYHSTLPPPNWEVVAESTWKIVKVTNSTGGAQHLISKDTTFLNFDLKVEWMVPNAGNSGIFIRYLEINEWGGASGPEAQVVDINHPDGKTELHRAGTDYDMFPLLPGRDNWWNPTGQWNQFRIIAFGTHVAHYGNGHRVAEYNMLSPAWNAAYNASKYKAYPKYAEVHSGSVYFQHHGELGIAYRDIRIKKLAAAQDPWAKGSPYVKPDGSGLIEDLTFADNLFTGSTRLGPSAPYGMQGLGGIRFEGGTSFGDAPSIRFPKRDDYALRILDLDGRASAAFHVKNADRFLLPVSQRPYAGRILEVTSGGETHSGVIGKP